MSAGQPARHAVRHHVALYGRETAVWLRAEDRLILGAIHHPLQPYPEERSAVHRSAARRATCIIHCHRHIRAPPASWDRKMSHQRHSSTACLRVFQGPLRRAAYHPQLLSSLIQQGFTPCLIGSLGGPELRPILVLVHSPRPILRSRYRAQCRIVPNVRTAVPYLFPSHRLAKRNACGTKRYGAVACQPVPTACRSSNA